MLGMNDMPAPSTRSVVLVEDEPAVRAQVAQHLKKLGYEVRATGDGEIALTMIRECLPDLLVLDLNLPRGSGYEGCEVIRTDPALQNMAVLMTSERLSLEIRAHSYEAGADAYLTK